MTESELLTRNPQSTLHTPLQHSQQQLQQQPSTSLLLNPHVRLESRPETFTASNLINSLETNYHSIVERFGNSPLTETTQYLTNNIIDPKEAKHLIDGFLCGVLVDAPNAEKHFTCIKTLAISTDQWMSLLTSFNILTLECFPFMKHSRKQQLLYFIDETLKLQLRTNLDSSFTNICRALSDGTDFKETCQIVHQFAHRLLSSHQKLATFPRNSSFPPTAFALFSRFISDAQLVANSGVMNLESFKAPLVEICVILVRERFPDLLQLGHDLFLLLLRLSRVSQFVPIWRTLLHNPAVMAPKFNGLQQLLSIPTSSGLLSHRVSLRISRKMAEILKNHIRISSLNATNPSLAAQLKSELNKQFETLKAMHLSGPDSGSIRAEIIRHVWAFIEPKEFNPHSNEARATLLGWLLRTAKPGAELQWCKLSFFWEWFGFDPSIPNSHLAAEPVISTIRHLLNTGHTPLGNSLVDFLIKATQQVSPVFLHSKLDQILRDQFRSTFPDFFPKRLTSIADNLAAPSSIIDFEAIRKTTTNSSSSCTNLVNKQSNVGGGTTENLMENEKLEKNVLINGRVVMGGGSNVVSSSTNESKFTSKRLPLTSLLPMVREEFREHLEGMFKAIKKKQNLSLEEAINSMQNLLDSIFDAAINVDLGEITEIMEQPLYRFFKTLCRSGEETDTRQFLLSILKKMMEECNRIGNNGSSWPSVDQAVETYKTVCQLMDTEWEKQLAKDLEQCSFDDYQLYSHLLVNVLARLTPYGPPTKVMRLICGSMNTRLLSRLMSEIVRENVVLFGEGEVLPMLVDSLKWDSLEQMMLWQMLQTEAVEFDKFIDLLQRLNYNQHPEATAAVIVIMRNMEPDPDVAIMKSLLRNLLLRPPNKDLFTVDAIKLLIDYDDNIPPVANCISKFVKKAVADGDIKGPICSPKHSSSSFSCIKMMKNRILTAEYIFGHLDRLRKYCMEKESQRAENLLKNQLLLDMALLVKRNVKTIELRNKFDELFALFDILLEDEQATNGGKQQRRKANNNKKIEGTPTKRKRRANKSSESDED
uniref:SOSS complex subunit A homolog n=1 Tax=Meloidogyne javanica TaxID=6303 RepID=A0A915MP47_MELJA